MSKNTKIIILVLVIVVIGIVAYFALRKPKAATTTSTTTTSTGGGTGLLMGLKGLFSLKGATKAKDNAVNGKNNSSGGSDDEDSVDGGLWDWTDELSSDD